jgi:glycerol-3-phosphate dehydrogenase
MSSGDTLMNNQYDAIIIGGGHNGLVAAAYPLSNGRGQGDGESTHLRR